MDLLTKEPKTQSSNWTNSTSVVAEISKKVDGENLKQRKEPESSELEKLSQQGNKENKRKKNYNQFQQPESSSVVASLDTASGRGKRIDSDKTTTHIIGVHKRKTTGRYESQITNPITKKQIWLGTFDTAEEASWAYQSKKLEFQKLIDAKLQQCTTNKHTHSKQDAGEEKLVNVKQGHENLNCHERFQPESAGASPENEVLLSNSSVEGTVQSIDFDNTTTHIIGVHKRKKTGRYESQITNPITKKQIWLGTFDTAEEASHAFQSKKLELQKLVNAKQQHCTTNKQTHSKQDKKSEKLVNVKQEHENVSCEDAFHGCLSEKFDSQKSKKVELQSVMPTGQEEEDSWKGEWVQLPGDRAVMFSLKLGLPIVDNYGSLLGEFSTLDDLSIT